MRNPSNAAVTSISETKYIMAPDFVMMSPLFKQRCPAVDNRYVLGRGGGGRGRVCAGWRRLILEWAYVVEAHAGLPPRQPIEARSRRLGLLLLRYLRRDVSRRFEVRTARVRLSLDQRGWPYHSLGPVRRLRRVGAVAVARWAQPQRGPRARPTPSITCGRAAPRTRPLAKRKGIAAVSPRSLARVSGYN